MTLLLGDAKLADHVAALEADRPRYVAALLLLLAHKAEVPSGARARALATAWARRDQALSAFLLGHPLWTVTEVLRAIELLDAGRRVRRLQKRVDALASDGRTSARRLGRWRSRLNDLQQEAIAASFTGAMAKKVRRWVQAIPAEKLEYYALTFPLSPWKALADLCHLAPSDFALPWFLAFVYGAPAPPESSQAAYQAATDEELPEVALRYRIPYSALRLRKNHHGSLAIREAVATYESLDTLLWFYEELQCPATDRRVDERLKAGEAPTFGYGKLVERIFACRSSKALFWKRLLPIADRQAHEIVAPIAPPVVVLGDASGSMDVAIRVATIMGAVLTQLATADLRFFSGKLRRPPVVPRRIADVLKVVDAIDATGATSPAAALLPSFSDPKPVRTFVVVTDEQENAVCEGMTFAPMLQRYQVGRPPVQVVFLSFIGQTAPGHMAPLLRAAGIPMRQFRLDANRPDLTRLDEFLAHMSVNSEAFGQRLETVTEWARAESISALMPKIGELLRVALPAPMPPAPSAEQPLSAPRSLDPKPLPRDLLGWLRHMLGV